MKSLAKLEQDIKEIKGALAKLDDKIGQVQFQVIRLLNLIGEGGAISPGSTAPVATPGGIQVDITPLEERLEQLSKTMVTKTDLEPLITDLKRIRDERMKEAEETIDNVTVLLEKGLALTEMTASLKQIEAHLEELVTPPKK